MSFVASEHSVSNGETFLIPQGPHVATAFAVIGVGMQETTYGPRNRVYVGWEIHDERFQWEKDGAENDIPASIWRAYNVSMHKNATLREDVEAWMGKTMTKEEVQTFDLFDLVGRPCQLTIEHSSVGDRIFNNVKSVNQLMRGVDVPPLESDEIRYLQPHELADWNLVPDFIRKKVEAQVKPEEKPEEEPEEEAEPFQDPIPF